MTKKFSKFYFYVLIHSNKITKNSKNRNTVPVSPNSAHQVVYLMEYRKTFFSYIE